MGNALGIWGTMVRKYITEYCRPNRTTREGNDTGLIINGIGRGMVDVVFTSTIYDTNATTPMTNTQLKWEAKQYNRKDIRNSVTQ